VPWPLALKLDLQKQLNLSNQQSILLFILSRDGAPVQPHSCNFIRQTQILHLQDEVQNMFDPRTGRSGNLKTWASSSVESSPAPCP
jgi:hypothetical protein